MERFMKCYQKKIKLTTNVRDNEIKPKYIMINERAYTQDEILIYNLQGYTKNTKVILEDISKYFQSYEQNVKVSLLKKHNYLIEFADYKQAANVLQNSPHRILNYTLYVAPCSSYNQPHIKNFIKYLEPKAITEECSFDEVNFLIGTPVEGCLISKLNDDCLMEICKNFNIQDEINFALCCQRFCHIIQTISGVKYMNFNMEILKALTCFQIKIFGSIIGPYIKDLKYYDTRFAKLFCTYCKNIETLRIECVTLEKDLLRFFNVNMPKLRKLIMKVIAWDNAEIEYLKLFKNLRSLNIDTSDVSGEYLASIEQLTELSLQYCNYIEPEHLEDICKNLKNLKYLDIRHCWQLTTKNFEQILENLIQLETLKLTNTKEDFVCISRLPQLKFLEINSEERLELPNDFIKELAKYQASQLLALKVDNIKLNLHEISLISGLENLKVLHCCSNDMLNDECLEKLSVLTKLQDVNFNSCSNISNEGILKILQHCLELKELSVVDCKRLSSELIRNAVVLLKDQHMKYLRTHRVQIHIEDLNLFQIDEPNSQVTNDILKITFESNKKYDFYRSKRVDHRSSGFYICRAFSASSRNNNNRYEYLYPTSS